MEQAIGNTLQIGSISKGSVVIVNECDHCLNGRSTSDCAKYAINHTDWLSAVRYLKNQLSPEQIAAEFPISHDTLYCHIYADKAHGGDLWRHLRCQKKRRKRYGRGRSRRGQIIGRRSISERPALIEERHQVGHWEGDTLMGARHESMPL